VGGYYTPTTGTPISTTAHNEYVRDQTVNQFASAVARTSAVGSPVAGMLSWRTDGALWEGHDGSSWLPVGRFTDVKRKTANESLNTNTTLQNDDHLVWAVVANAVYLLDLCLIYNTSAVPNIKIGFTFPSGLTMTYGGVYVNTSGGLTVGQFNQASTPAFGGLAADTPQRFAGVVRVGGTGGNLQLQFAQNTSNAAATALQADSFGVLTRVA